MRCGKKLVVRVVQRVAPLIPVQRLLSFFEPGREELHRTTQNKLLLMKVSDRDRNVKVKMLVVLK